MRLVEIGLPPPEDQQVRRLPESHRGCAMSSRREVSRPRAKPRRASSAILIAEMKTGEGKTLVATLPVYLNALTGNGVQPITYLVASCLDRWLLLTVRR